MSPHCRFCLEEVTRCCDSCDRLVCDDHRTGNPDTGMSCAACYLRSAIDHDLFRYVSGHRAELAKILERERVWFGADAAGVRP
jgi:hypothetical protein